MILVTGANGFIGRGVGGLLVRRGTHFRALVRDRAYLGPGEPCSFSSLSDAPALRQAADGMDVVIHLAGRAHQFGKATANTLEGYLEVNCRGVLNMAEAARQSGVKRFVFLSSVNVLGTDSGETPFGSDTPAAPSSPAAQAKHQAELALMEMAEKHDFQVVILRTPMVYGPGAKGNLALFLKAVHKGLPLPFAGVRNRRSLIGLENLADLLIGCASHLAAANQVLLAGENPPLSTPELLTALGDALGKPARLFALPTPVLEMLGRLACKGEAVRSLCGSLEVDTDNTRQLLDWVPRRELQSEMQDMARCYLSSLESGQQGAHAIWQDNHRS